MWSALKAVFRGNKALWFGVGAIVLVVIIVIALVTHQSTPLSGNTGATSPDQAANLYITALVKADAKASYALNTDGYKARVSETQWKTLIGHGFSGLSTITPILIKLIALPDPYHSYKVTDEAKQAMYTIQSGADKYRIALTIVHTGSGWKIDEMRTDKL